jgi:two-component system, NtrC family, response regulator PilR
MTESAQLLVIDDEPDLRTLYELTLLRAGHHIDTAGCVEEALLSLQEKQFDVVITDLRLPDGTGLDVLRYIETHHRPEKVVVITAYGSTENAIEALKAGAFDYLTKPVDLKQFRTVIANALTKGAPQPPLKEPPPMPAAALPEVRAASTRSAKAVAPIQSQSPALQRMIGHTPLMQEMRQLIAKVARSMAPILVLGESGTGKELVARAIHECSPRHDQPFIAVNCSAIPEALLEAEFFGYRKGAFTGAQDHRDGFFQAAHGGTLFLDEIGDLPVPMQSKLLRAVQERAIRPVGAVQEQAVNVRLVSATHKDLATLVSQQQFRQDLYYRLNVIQIHVPALRERLEDLPAICDFLLQHLARDSDHLTAPTLTPGALKRLSQHLFPGNVRELENMLHRALALTQSDRIEEDELGLPHLSAETRNSEAVSSFYASYAASPAAPGLSFLQQLDEIEKQLIQKVLIQHADDIPGAATELGLSERQLRFRLHRLELS